MKVQPIQQNQTFKGTVSPRLEANIREVAKNNIAEIVAKANEGGVAVDEKVIKSLVDYTNVVIQKLKNYMLLLFPDDIVLYQANPSSNVDFVYAPQKSVMQKVFHVIGTKHEELDGKYYGNTVGLIGIPNTLSDSFKYVQDYENLVKSLVQKVSPKNVQKQFLNDMKSELNEMAVNPETKLASKTSFIKKVFDKFIMKDQAYLDVELETYKRFASETKLEDKAKTNMFADDVLQKFKVVQYNQRLNERAEKAQKKLEKQNAETARRILDGE